MSRIRQSVIQYRFLLGLTVICSIPVAPHAAAHAAGPNHPPTLQNVNAVLYAGMVYVSGYVYDADGDTNGWPVQINGDVWGEAFVGADNRFWFRMPYYGTYGEGSVRTQDPQGAPSNTAYFEFVE